MEQVKSVLRVYPSTGTNDFIHLEDLVALYVASNLKLGEGYDYLYITAHESSSLKFLAYPILDNELKHLEILDGKFDTMPYRIQMLEEVLMGCRLDGDVSWTVKERVKMLERSTVESHLDATDAQISKYFSTNLGYISN